MQRYFLWVTVGTVLLLIAEVLAGRHKGAYRKGDAPLLIGSLVLGRTVCAPAATFIVASAYGLLLPQYKGALKGTPLWISYPAVLLAAEFCFYWVHRWAHTTAASRFLVLWKIHRTHHSGGYMNTTLLARLNLFWYFVLPTGWVTGLALHLGLGDGAAAAILTLMAWNAITHAHFRWDDPIRRHRLFGPAFRALEHVIVSPGMHHTHHGYGRDGAAYRNFAIVLSLYDWMFGTLLIPSGRPSRYGLPGHDAHWLEELLYPAIRVGRARSPAKDPA
jgi:sterol desaturase/sphingolipid hydroxylase (fatty acid hydroxylase superfamily)